MRKLLVLVCILLLSAALNGCSDDDSGGEPTPDAGTDEDAGPTDDIGDNGDADGGDGDVGDDACTPMTCEDLGESCGIFDDGCGDEIDCGDCTCDEATYLDDCPTSPCEKLVGCESGECSYEPVEIDGAACTECVDGECGSDDVRYCISDDGTCPEAYCDPAPESTEDGTRYHNEELSSHVYECGLCDLGVQICDGGQFHCDDIEIEDVDSEFAECDSTQSGTTFVYVDSTFTGSDQDGSRDRPFASLNEGLESAHQRNSAAVIVGGDSVFDETIDLQPGISILGGFDHQPYWHRNTEKMPAVNVGSDQIEGELLVGLRAVDINTYTEIQRLQVETADVEGHESVSTAALYAVDAGGLHLQEVFLSAGRGGDGVDSDSQSAATTPGGDGEDGHDGDQYEAPHEHIGNCQDLFGDELSDVAVSIPPEADGGTHSACSEANGGYGGRADIHDFDASAYETGHRPGGNSASGQCENPYGSTDNSLYDSDNACGGRLFKSAFYDTYENRNGRDGLAHSGPAQDGADGTLEVTVDGLDWQLHGHGEAGEDGAHGRGGGGGASGYTAYTAWDEPEGICFLAPGGGGGGAGGCGGAGGQGGRAGGWSVGIVAQNSTGLILESVDIASADGGDGGEGGSGGTGSPGGSGGSGGEPTSEHADLDDFPMPDGKDGGDGSDGQTGGTGGDGAGGSSIAIYCPAADTTIETADLSMSHGAGGSSNGDDGLQRDHHDCDLASLN